MNWLDGFIILCVGKGSSQEPLPFSKRIENIFT